VTLLAEDLLLLMLDEQTGRQQLHSRPYVIGAALLVDLALAGMVDVRRWHPLLPLTLVRARPADRPVHPALAGAVDEVNDRSIRTSEWRLDPVWPSDAVRTARLLARAASATAFRDGGWTG